jgi:helicase MOV-10
MISDEYSLKLLLSPPPQFSHIVGLLESVHAIDPDLYKQYVDFYRSNRLPELALQHRELNYLSEVIFREKSWQIQPAEYLKILYKLTIFEEIQTKLDIAKFDLHFIKINFELLRDNNSLMSIPLKCKLHVQGSNESRPRILIGDKIRIRPTVEDCSSRRMNLFELQGLVSNYQLQSEEVTCVFAVQNVFSIDGVQSSPAKLIDLLSSMKFDVRFSYDRSSFAMMKILLNSRMVLSNYLIESLFPNPTTIARLRDAKQIQQGSGLPLMGSRSASNYVRLSAEFNQEQSRAIYSILDWCDLNNASSHLVYAIPPFIIFGPPGTGKTRTVTASILEILRAFPHKRILACAPSEAAADVIALRLLEALPDRSRMFRHNWWQRMVSSVPIKLLSCCCQHGNLFELPSVEQLMNFSVIVTTCSAAGALAFYETIRFDVVIIDEASQATEAEVSKIDDDDDNE